LCWYVRTRVNIKIKVVDIIESNLMVWCFALPTLHLVRGFKDRNLLKDFMLLPPNLDWPIPISYPTSTPIPSPTHIPTITPDISATQLSQEIQVAQEATATAQEESVQATATAQEAIRAEQDALEKRYENLYSTAKDQGINIIKSSDLITNDSSVVKFHYSEKMFNLMKVSRPGIPRRNNYTYIFIQTGDNVGWDLLKFCVVFTIFDNFLAINFMYRFRARETDLEGKRMETS